VFLIVSTRIARMSSRRKFARFDSKLQSSNSRRLERKILQRFAQSLSLALKRATLPFLLVRCLVRYFPNISEISMILARARASERARDKAPCGRRVSRIFSNTHHPRASPYFSLDNEERNLLLPRKVVSRTVGQFSDD